MRKRLNDWAERGDAQTEAPRWLVWSTATWARTFALALMMGVLGLLSVLHDPDHWGVGDDVGGFAGGVLGALIIRYLIQRKPRTAEGHTTPEV